GAGPAPALPTAGLLTDFLDAQAEPIWLARSSGELAWANQAWLRAAEGPTLESAKKRTLSFDKGADARAREAVPAGKSKAQLRWITGDGGRRAVQLLSRPIPAGLV